MDEVDNIILQALHQLGISFGDDVNTLSDFPDELVLESVKKCLDVIMGNSVTQKLPNNTSQKIVIANEIVSQCRKLGFKGDLGYELILYPNELDLRRIFTFLIDKLPKETDKSFIPRDNFSMLMQNISQRISQDLQKPWSPPYCHKRNVDIPVGGWNDEFQCKHLFPFNEVSFKVSSDATNIYQEFLTYWKNNVCDDICMRTSNDVTPAKELEAESIMNKLKQSKSRMSNLKMTSLLVNRHNMQNDNSGSNKNRIDPSVLSMKELADAIRKIEDEKESMINKIKMLHTKRDELSAEINAERTKESILKEKKEMHSLVTSLLPEFDTNIEKLKKIREKEMTKLTNLNNEIVVRETEAKKERELNNEFKAKQAMYTDEINILEGKKNRLSQELKKQSSLKLQLKRDWEKRNMKKKYIKKRSAYTKRIMEIIGNVAKQKMEINKILSDTRVLQKEMNNLNGRLDRSFAVVDELVFKDAKKDEHARKTYKLIAFIHTGCGEIVNNVNDIGSHLRETRDLEKRVETEKKKKIQENLQRVYSDLKYLQSKREKHN